MVTKRVETRMVHTFRPPKDRPPFKKDVHMLLDAVAVNGKADLGVVQNQ